MWQVQVLYLVVLECQLISALEDKKREDRPDVSVHPMEKRDARVNLNLFDFDSNIFETCFIVKFYFKIRIVNKDDWLDDYDHPLKKKDAVAEKTTKLNKNAYEFAGFWVNMQIK
ncbi:hypothetical protein HELRODRAFT_159221 [Helobdella robusta]|uniref:Uncharacterized protein n=1 Tax=Helobdella robusta TaxID=6412 RepID=T1ENR4_HELRO|nr:hypothetical protein HELRODRAFT_159221 [Helobdella robusta]ESO12645.1 hypothetical protein HELRODRAFT_159221 [Helobdella robusta]